MTPRWLLAVAGTLAALGCTPYILKDSSLKDSIPGPHIGPYGEPLVELPCTSPEQCRPVALKTCHGDLGLANSTCTSPVRLQTHPSPEVVLVACENAPGSPPGDMHVAAPDAGP
jgi:hypothetical protein